MEWKLLEAAQDGAPPGLLLDALAIVLASNRDGPYNPRVAALEARAREIVRAHADIVLARLLAPPPKDETP